jgi:hypothetical protein
MDDGGFYPEQKILGAGVSAGAITGGDGPVIAHLVSPAVTSRAAATIKTIAVPPVVSMPGGVARLKYDVTDARVIADDERNLENDDDCCSLFLITGILLDCRSSMEAGQIDTATNLRVFYSGASFGLFHLIMRYWP